MESSTSVTVFDDLDLQLLQALETDGRAPFSRIASVLGVSDQTIARRYRRLRTEGGLRVIGVREISVRDQDNWRMLRLRCTPDASESIARALARRPDTTWIVLCSGGTEVVCMTLARTRDEDHELIFGKLPRTPRITDIRAHQLLHRFYGGPEGWLGKSGALSVEQVAALTPDYAEGPAPTAIAPEDDPLVAALKSDGRATFAELQKATGRSESAVRRRLDQLLASGALFVDVQFDAEHLGYGMFALLWITAAPASFDTVGRALATHPEVAFAAAAAGPYNIVATIVCRDSTALYTYLSERLGKLEGVQHIETSPILRRVKQLSYEEGRTGRGTS
ncbi:Lrp/AsnC family transcriptional regulator [Streptomyces beijiangensis]|uniref:Lrp/AsnC family transcriptional regulator n=1 Tax=Streptomyces beijiangensis TaxID=163361 RepID=A0A939FD37_9ACTN|nr:AsnC family transcriptional regulator [Streptomyces beijiangensis]MBO0515217.1 Lrp/AsnC family transcriptional regulator [Streptomyces beijiangensis]